MKLKATLLIGSLYFFSPLAIAAADFMPGKLMERDRSGPPMIRETYMGTTTNHTFSSVQAGNARGSVTSSIYIQMERYILGRQRSGEPYVCTKVGQNNVRIFRTQQGNNTPVTVKFPWQCLRTNLSNRTKPYSPVRLDTNPEGAYAATFNPFTARRGGQERFNSYTLSGYGDRFEARVSHSGIVGPNFKSSMEVYEKAWRSRDLKKRPFACARIKKLNGTNNVTFLSVGTFKGNLNGMFSKMIFVTNNPLDCYRK